MKFHKKWHVLVFLLLPVFAQAKVSYVHFFGYDSCILLSNESVKVIVETQCGGRVLKYALAGYPNTIYLDPNQKGLITDVESKGYITGGRYDIGPPKIKPDNSVFWYGKWQVHKISDLSFAIRSAIDTSLGIYIERNFSINSQGSELNFSQTIHNVGNKKHKLCNWSRTFAVGGGKVIIPLSIPNRFPKGYIVYGENNTMWYQPELEPTTFVKDSLLFIIGSTGKYKKYVVDSQSGWLAYFTPESQLLIRRYQHFTGKQYGEMTAVSMSVWYNENEMVELEPMGPWEWIEPGGSSTFNERWYLFDTNNIFELNEFLKLTNE